MPSKSNPNVQVFRPIQYVPRGTSMMADFDGVTRIRARAMTTSS
jgi:hypothetical protein